MDYFRIFRLEYNNRTIFRAKYEENAICHAFWGSQSPLYAEHNDATITIQLKNTAFSPREIQVKETACPQYLPRECLLLEEVLAKCKKGEDIAIGICILNKRKHEAAGCLIPGLIFNSRLAGGGNCQTWCLHQPDGIRQGHVARH